MCDHVHTIPFWDDSLVSTKAFPTLKLIDSNCTFNSDSANSFQFESVASTLHLVYCATRCGMCSAVGASVLYDFSKAIQYLQRWFEWTQREMECGQSQVRERDQHELMHIQFTNEGIDWISLTCDHPFSLLFVSFHHLSHPYTFSTLKQWLTATVSLVKSTRLPLLMFKDVQTYSVSYLHHFTP